MFRLLPFVLLAVLAAWSRSSSPSSDSPTPGAEPPSATSSATPATPSSAGRPAGDDPPPASALIKPVPAQLPSVVARVNGEDVSKGDFQKAIDALERQAGSPIPQTERDRVFRGVLERLIGFRLLLQESRSRHLAVPDTDVDARLNVIRQQFPTEEAFKNAIAAQKLTVDQVRTETRQELLVSKLLEAEVGPKSAVTTAEIERVYKDNPEAFKLPEQVRASHILFLVTAGADASVKAEALAKATSVLKSARAGKDFAALAKEFSQDPGSAAQGGDLDFFRADQMVPPFSEAAFRLRPGTISDVVETQFGYHIIKVVEKQPGRTVPLDEARPEIERRLLLANRERQMQAFVKVLRDKGKVEVLI